MPEETRLPDEFAIRYHKVRDCKYGENPDQNAAAYKMVMEIPTGSTGTVKMVPITGMLDWEQLGGQDLSFNNYCDAAGAYGMLAGMEKPTAATIKHAQISGLAWGPDICEAYTLAHQCDPQADLGNITVVNRPVTPELARFIGRDREVPESVYTEILIANEFEEDAVEILAKKQKRKMQLLKATGPTDMPFDIKLKEGVALAQTKPDYTNRLTREQLIYPLGEEPDPETLEKLLAAWEIVRKVDSNGAMVGNGKYTDGRLEYFWTLGTGSFRKRVGAVRIALNNAGERAEGGVLASDGFFPFPDSVDEAAGAGISAIITGKGSRNDHLTEEACRKYKIILVYSPVRVFKHP
jgi:phosphoribosylaminoimidazolecarboxamide formyltransferase/IMP cyclohydrolase